MAKSLRERAFSWIRKRKKERNTLTSTIKSAPSKPTRQTSEYHAPTQTKSSYSGGGGSVWNGSSRPASSGTKKETPKHAVGYRPAAKMAIGAKAKEQQTKAKSVAEAMKSSEKGLTDREKALKHNVQKAVLNVGNRVGKDYAKDLKSGLYTSKATEQEKKNVAKSIEKDYNKKAKSKKAEAVAGFTKSDANIKAVTKGVTGKDIDTSKVTKSKAYKGGEVAQELASYAIAPNEAAGKAVGKLAVKAIAKNALKKSGKKATKRVVNGAMQKAAADFAKSKGKTFASKRAGEMLANAPLNAKYAADRAKDEKTGKIDKKKFAKDFALNTGFDVGIGSAIGGVQLGKAAKAAKRSAREAKMGKMLDSRIKKVEKANKTVKAEKPKVAPTTAKRVKAKVTKKSELNLGQAVKEEYAGIDKRVEKGIISKSEAKKQRKALANEVERRTGGTGVRLNKGYAEVTKKGLKAIDDSDNKLNFDRRIKNVEKIKDKIDKKAAKKTEFKGLTDEEIREARESERQARFDREQQQLAEDQAKNSTALTKSDLDEIEKERQTVARRRGEKTLAEDYRDRVRHVQSIAKSKAAGKRQAKAVKEVHKSQGFSDDTVKRINAKIDEYKKTGDKAKLRDEIRQNIKEAVVERTPIDDNTKNAIAEVKSLFKRGFYRSEGIVDSNFNKKEAFREYGTRFFNKGGKVRRGYVDTDYKELNEAFGESLFPMTKNGGSISEGDAFDQMRKVANMNTDDIVRKLGDYPTSERELEDFADDLTEQYIDALAKAEPKAKAKVRKRVLRNKTNETPEVDETPSRQEIAELFGETRRKQPKGKKVEGKLPERIQKKIDATAEPKATEKATAEEPQSIVTEEKTAEPTNTSTTEETSLKSPENKNPKDDTITAKEDKLMDAVDNLDDTKMMTTHGDNLSDFSKEQRAKLKNKSAKPKATELAETPEPETPALKDKDFKVSDHVSPEEKASGKAKFNSVITDIRRKLENSMGFSEREAARWARRNHQPEFAARFTGLVNNMRQSTQRASYSFLNEQIDYNGNRVGESFSDIAKDIKGKSPGHYENVQDYLYLVNHADRMDNAKRLASGEEKAVKGAEEQAALDLPEKDKLPDTEQLEFIAGNEPGDKRLFNDLSPEEARRMAQELIDNDPELLKDANRIIRYFRNDLKSQVQAGLISEDTFYHYIDTYPNYVPAHRQFGTAKLSGKPYEPNLKSLRAKGSGLDLLPIEDQAKLSAEYTFTRGSTNDVSKAIAKMSGYSEDALKLYEDTDGVDATDVALFFDKKNGRLRFFDNGELKSVEVPQQYLKDIEDAHISATSSEGLNAILNLFGGGNRIFKELITSYNPAFVVKNFFRDFPEGALQSQNMGLYFKNLGLGKSAVSLATNDEWARAYKRMGGQHGQFINSASDIFKEENWLKKNTLGKIEAWNEITEQMPRLAEFRAYLEKLGKTPKTATPDELRRAAEAAADVTVNFGRSGSIGRIVNKSVIPFFNPAVQGFAKIGRVLTKDKSVSGYVKLLSKMAVLGAGPELVNEMIIGDNPNYQMINERDRAVNYYIPLDADNPLNVLFGSNINGTKDGEVFLKIPKARFLSIIGMGTQSIRGTNDIPFVDFLKISKDQIGPVGVSNNIFQQFINSGVLNNKSKGKTWYGADIENTGDTNKLPKDRYDEKTSSIARTLGEITGRSPKKIDYLLDSYTGVIGDIALPATASAAQRGGSGPIGAIRSFAAKNFSTDSVSQNNLTNKVYERVDELTQKKGSGDTSAETEYGLSYFNKRNAKASEIRDKIRSIQNSSKSKEQKAREVRPLQRELNKLNKTTLDTEKSFVKAAKKYVDRLSNAPLADETKKNYGIENAMIATAKDRGEDPWKLVKEYTKQSKYRPKYAKYAKAAGLSPVEYKEFYNLREYDLDQSGGMPSKKEATTYLNSRDDLTQEQKAVLYAGLGGWLAKGPNPYGSVGGSRVGSGGSGGRRYGSRRRYSSRRSSGGSRKSTSGKAVGATTTTNKPKSVKLTSVADIMKSSNSKTATASALAKILKSSTQADYEAAAKKAVSKRKKDIYKISAKRT